MPKIMDCSTCRKTKNIWVTNNSNGRPKFAKIDHCIADEIDKLNRKGILTQCCCCGHGKEKANCIINKDSDKQARELGYKLLPFEFSKNSYLIYLKNQPQQG